MEQRTPANLREPREIRLYLIAPAVAGNGLGKALQAALEAGDVAAVLFPAEFDGRNELIAAVQKANAAVLTLPEVQSDGIDGVHVDGDIIKFATLRRLKPDAIVGFGGVARRHDGMSAAEAGADYVVIGRLADGSPLLDMPTRVELLEWWQSMMTIPCVSRANTEREAEQLAEAGADFVALAPTLWADGAGAATVATLTRRFAEIARAELEAAEG